MTILPIVERELRITARRKGTYRLRFFSALGAIAIFLFYVANRHTWMSNAMLARQIFETTAGFAMVICTLAGVFLTADCLSSEKREGTIGLLFLTDLRGYDVVSGKLTASSVHSFYALLSMLPVLGLPLLMGGVAAGEFWRMILVLMAALLFSLGLGMFVSAMARDGRQSFALTLFLIILFTGVLPATYGVGRELAPLSFASAGKLLWPSVGYTFAYSTDAYYHSSAGRAEYWCSLLTVAAIGIAGLVLASLALPRAWQEKAHAKSGRGSGWGRRLRFGTPERRRAWRRRFLGRNPFYWLVVRDRSSLITVWGAAAVAVSFWLFGSIGLARSGINSSSGNMLFTITMFSTFILSLILKYTVALEATRRFCDDRQSGALELLLVTPLTVNQMLAGQKHALRSLFGLPLAIVTILLLLELCIIRVNMRGNNDDTVAFIMVGNIVCLFIDFSALGWLGMWRGLRAGKHHRAILGTMIPILVVPWLVYFFMGVTGMLDGRRPETSLGIWFGFGIVNDFIWIQRSKFKLRRQFRAVVAGIAPKSDPQMELIDLSVPATTPS